MYLETLNMCLLTRMSLRMQLSMYFNIIGGTTDPEVRFMQKSGLLPKEEGLAYLTDKKKQIISIAQCLPSIYFMQLALYTYKVSTHLLFLQR